MLELAKLNETENKPKNVEEAIKAGWRTAKEMYECACVDRRTWQNFIQTIKKYTLQKPNTIIQKWKKHSNYG